MLALVALLALGPQTPTIVSRAAWGAKPVLPTAKSHEIRYVTIHHTGTASNKDVPLETKLRNLQAWSQREDKLAGGRTKPAWPDIPYHYYISIDGRIGEAREVAYAGDTNTEYDPTGRLLIVVEGNFENEQPTPAQLDSLRRMTLWAAREFRVPAERVAGHGDYARTSCPGLALLMEVRKLRERVRRGTGVPPVSVMGLPAMRSVLNIQDWHLIPRLPPDVQGEGREGVRR